MNRVVLLLSLCFIIEIASLGAQESNIPAWLVISYKEADIEISWAPGAYAGLYGIWRHSAVIDANTFQDAELITTVAAATRKYLDQPSTAGTYFYALLPLGIDGTPQRSFIPNRTISGTKIELTEQEIATRDRAYVKQLNAVKQGERIYLYFLISRNDRPLNIFRAARPITSVTDLRLATNVGTIAPGTQTFIDTSSYDIPEAYYLVADTATQQTTFAFVQIEPGINATTAPVRIDGNEFADGVADYRPEHERRDLTLPSISGLNARTSFMELRPLEPELYYADTYPTSDPPTTISSLSPYIFPDDIDSTLTGNAAILRQILLIHFSNQNWPQALKFLGNLFNTNISNELRQRVHFYRGQALFFNGDYRNAILEFLLTGNQLKEIQAPWVEAAISRLSP